MKWTSLMRGKDNKRFMRGEQKIRFFSSCIRRPSHICSYSLSKLNYAPSSEMILSAPLGSLGFLWGEV